MGITNNIPPSRLIQPGVIDNTAARPASPFEGQCIFQKDTDQLLVWNGSAWVIPNQTTQNPEGLELVGKVVAGSGATTLSINNVFSDSYDAYKIIIAGGTSSGSSTLSMQLMDSSGNPAITGYYETFIYSAYAGSTVASANGNNLSNFQRTANSFGYSMTGSFEILNPFSAQPTYYFNAPSPLGGNAGQSIGYQTSVSSYTGMKLTISAGTISSTVLTVYGYRK